MIWYDKPSVWLDFEGLVYSRIGLLLTRRGRTEEIEAVYVIKTDMYKTWLITVVQVINLVWNKKLVCQ